MLCAFARILADVRGYLYFGSVWNLDSILDIILFLFITILSYWISAIIHELGHVIVGLVNGWKLFLFVVGPIGIKRKNGILSLYFEKNLVMWGGVGGTFPVKENEDNIKIWSKILLSGPIASIITGMIFLSLCFLHFHIFLLLLGLMPIGIGIACLLPLETGILYTDGKRWRRLHGGGQEEAEEIALWKMTEFQQFGKDKSLMQREDFEALFDAKLPALRYYGYYYLYKYYDIQNDFDNRNQILEILNSIKKDVPKAIVNDCEL